MKYDDKKKILSVTTSSTEDMFGMKDIDGKPEKVKIGKQTQSLVQEMDDVGINNWLSNLSKIQEQIRNGVKKTKEQVKQLKAQMEDYEQQSKVTTERIAEIKRALPKDFVFTTVPDYVPEKEENGVNIK